MAPGRFTGTSRRRGGALGEALPLPAEEGAWSGAGRRFARRRSACLGLAVVVLFLSCAALAPFLAGSKPLVLDRGQGLEFPVFRTLQTADLRWLAGAGAFLCAWAGGAWIARTRRRRGLSPGVVRERVLLFLGILLAATVVTMLLPERLDRSDYSDFRDGRKTAVVCVFPPVPWSPHEFDNYHRLESPGPDHLLGTDSQGRDLLARLIHGTRVSMLVGFVAVSIYVAIGVLVGALAGYFGGWVDILLSRFMEAVICFPVFFAIISVFCFLPPSIFWVMVLIGLLRWPGVARLVRGEFLRIKNEEFVAAAHALGVSPFRIIFRHVLPNGLAPVLVSATFGVAGAVLLESGLSFLRFGADLSWGAMLAGGKDLWTQCPWLTLFPGAAIFLAVTAFNLVGEGLRDALDPRMRP